jgi:hypothetical protein
MVDEFDLYSFILMHQHDLNLTHKHELSPLHFLDYCDTYKLLFEPTNARKKKNLMVDLY